MREICDRKETGSSTCGSLLFDFLVLQKKKTKLIFNDESKVQKFKLQRGQITLLHYHVVRPFLLQEFNSCTINFKCPQISI